MCRFAATAASVPTPTASSLDWKMMIGMGWVDDTCLGRQALAHRGFETRRLPSPGLAGLPKPLPGLWPLSHANSYGEPQVRAECRVETKGGRALLKRTWQPPSQRYYPTLSPHTPQGLDTVLCNNIYLLDLVVSGDVLEHHYLVRPGCFR